MLLNVVVLDATGGRDARTMEEALSRVSDGGVIRVRPGRYREDVRIDKPVSVVRDQPADDPPVFGNFVVSTTGTVTLESITIEANDSATALSVAAGNVELIDCTVLNPGPHRPEGGMTSAIVASGGRLRIEGGLIGPGGDAAIVASGSSRVSAQAVTIIGEGGYGFYGTDQARVRISGAKISGTVAILVDEHSRVQLSGNHLTGLSDQFVVSLANEADVQMMGNRIGVVERGRIVDATNENWLRIAPTVSGKDIRDNFTGNGRRLRVPGDRRRRRRS